MHVYERVRSVRNFHLRRWFVEEPDFSDTWCTYNFKEENYVFFLEYTYLTNAFL